MVMCRLLLEISNQGIFVHLREGYAFLNSSAIISEVYVHTQFCGSFATPYMSADTHDKEGTQINLANV